MSTLFITNSIITQVKVLFNKGCEVLKEQIKQKREDFKQKKSYPKWKFVTQIIAVIIGALIFAIPLETILIPNGIMDGGIVGIAIMLAHIFGVPTGVFILTLNIPFLYLGYKQIGAKFAILSSIGIGTLSLATVYLHHWDPFIQDELLLATIFGGMILGAGVGLVIKFGGVLDGTETLSILLSKKLPFSVAQIILYINVVIFTVAAFVFTPKQAMYSILAYYIAAKTIDIVVSGMSETKAFFIITKHHKEIGDVITNRLGRSYTLFNAEGGFKGEEYKIIYTVTTKIEESKLHTIIYEIDEDAVVTGHITDIRGGSFAKKDIH